MEDVNTTAEEGVDLDEAYPDDAIESEDVFVRYRNSASRARQTLSAASRLLRKKIPQSGHLMLPRRLWMQTVPTQDCDAIVLLSPTASEVTVNWLLHRLKTRVPELTVSVRRHQAVNSFAFYVTSTLFGLLKGGEELKINKKTKPEYGNGSREFNQSELNIFQGVEDPATFFTSQERQSIVLHGLHSMRATEDEEVSGIMFRSGQGIVCECLSKGLIQQIVPLHDHQQLKKLRLNWVQTFFNYQPLDEIYQYFGAKIGIYFSWLGFYTASLTVPTIIGFTFWLNFWGRDQAKEDKAFVVLALLNVVWGSAWLEAWKRRSAELSYRWGTLDNQNKLLEDPRPHFEGELRISPVTGRAEPFYPEWKRNLFRYCVTLPVMFTCITLGSCVLFLILEVQGWWDSMIERRGSLGAFSYGPKFIIAAVISIFDELYTKIAVYLNNKENYRSENDYHSNVIIKIVMFRLVNAFFVLFYIAFYLQDVDALKEQLAALFLTRQIVGNLKESCIPYIMEQLKLAKLSFDLFGALSPSQEAATGDFSDHAGAPKSDNPANVPHMPNRSRIVGQAEVEANMAKYDGICEDYLEMYIQFGYVMLFSSAFPLAALCAFVNNLIEIRSDAFKLCCVFQRPFAQRAKNIGVWQDLMELMCILGIIVNCMLIGLSGQVHRMFPGMSTTQNILLIVVLEHVMIGLKYGISYAIPDVPDWVAHQVARSEFNRREALKKLSISSSPPTREVSEQSSPRSYPVSNMPSMEYIERAAQTERRTPLSRKDSEEQKCPIKEVSVSSKDDLMPKVAEVRKGSMDRETEPKFEVLLGRSVSAGDKAKQYIPKVSKRWDQSCLDTADTLQGDYPLGRPNITDSLPTLSTSPSSTVRKPFKFSPDRDRETIDYKTVDPPADDETASSADSIASAIRDQTLAKDLLDYKVVAKGRKKPPQLSKLNKTNFASVQCLSLTRQPTPAREDEATEMKTDFNKVSKRHPAKFLKRAQSFSQVFKKMATPTEKKKKAFDPLMDEYNLLMRREPQGELSLIPVEHLVSMEDVQKHFTLNESAKDK